MMSVKELREWLSQFDENDVVCAAENEGAGYIEINDPNDPFHCKGQVQVD